MYTNTCTILASSLINDEKKDCEIATGICTHYAPYLIYITFFPITVGSVYCFIYNLKSLSSIIVCKMFFFLSCSAVEEGCVKSQNYSHWATFVSILAKTVYFLSVNETSEMGKIVIEMHFEYETQSKCLNAFKMRVAKQRVYLLNIFEKKKKNEIAFKVVEINTKCIRKQFFFFFKYSIWNLQLSEIQL